MLRKFSPLLGVCSSFTDKGSGDKVASCFWDTLRFGDILLGPAKLLGSGFLGFVINGLSNLQGGITFFFQGSCRFLYLKILKLIPFCCLFTYRMARGRE